MHTASKEVILMRCLTRETLFNFIHRELSAEDQFMVESHLETCDKCNMILRKLTSEITMLKTNLDGLNPEKIPDINFEMPIAVNTQKNNLFSKSYFHPIFSPKFGMVIVILVILITYIILNTIIEKETRLTDEDIQKWLIFSEQYIDDDPKKDWNERRLLVTILDAEKNTAVIIKTSIDKNHIDHEVLQLNPPE